jgi:hypothetical protein
VICKTCRFYQGTQFGHCRRYPESVMKQHNNWCGEHLPIAETLKEELKERKKREPKTSA